VASLRIVVYTNFNDGGDGVDSRGIRSADQAKARVRATKSAGADGIELVGIDRDIMTAALQEARASRLPIAHHIGVEETTVWDDIRLGTRSIEHWYTL
jgi:hypothetical protein